MLKSIDIKYYLCYNIDKIRDTKHPHINKGVKIMTTEIIISVSLASRRTGNYTPSENAYFTSVQGDIYDNFRLPDGWSGAGHEPKGIPHRKAVTVSLPDFIHAVPGGIRSDYKATDGNVDLVFAFVPAIRVTGSYDQAIDFDQAIDEALKGLTITAPTASGKREEIPFEIVSVSPLFDANQL